MSSIDLGSLDNFWLFIVIMGTLKFLFELARVYKSYQENRYFSLDKVKEAFETDKIDNKLRKQLVETYEKEIFHKVYRLSISKEARDKIIDISNRDDAIECTTFKKANKYIDYDRHNLTLKYGEIYPTLKLFNKYLSYFYYMACVILVIGFLVLLFDYEYLSKFYRNIGSPYFILLLSAYAFLASFLCIKKEVALEAVIKLRSYALSYPDDIKIIYRDSRINKIIDIFLNI